MIIPNGTIRFASKAPTGIDPDTGHPRQPVLAYSDPVACQYMPSQHNRLAATPEGYHHTVEHYTILIDRIDSLPAEQIAIYNQRHEPLGTFSVIAVERLDTVLQTRITV